MKKRENLNKVDLMRLRRELEVDPVTAIGIVVWGLFC